MACVQVIRGSEKFSVIFLGEARVQYDPRRQNGGRLSYGSAFPEKSCRPTAARQQILRAKDLREPKARLIIARL